MSDPQASKPEAPIGEPVVEPAPTDDVVDRANGSLAEAEAARDGVPVDTGRDETAVTAVPADDVNESTGDPVEESSYGPDAAADVSDRVTHDDADTAVVAPATAGAAAADSSADETPWYDRPEHLQPAGATAPETDDAGVARQLGRSLRGRSHRGRSRRRWRGRGKLGRRQLFRARIHRARFTSPQHPGPRILVQAPEAPASGGQPGCRRRDRPAGRPLSFAVLLAAGAGGLRG